MTVELLTLAVSRTLIYCGQNCTPRLLYGRFHRTADLGSCTASFRETAYPGSFMVTFRSQVLGGPKTGRTTAKVSSSVKPTVQQPRCAVLTAVNKCPWNCQSKQFYGHTTKLPYVDGILKCISAFAAKEDTLHVTEPDTTNAIMKIPGAQGIMRRGI